MRPVYRGIATSLLLAVVTVAALLWQIRQSDLKAIATKADIQALATKADIATINTQRKSEMWVQETARDKRYNVLVKKIDGMKRVVEKHSK